MSLIVYDSSALLAFLGGEPGADEVERALDDGGSCSAANWSEVAQKVANSRAGDWTLARALLIESGLRIESVTLADAERAAELWIRGEGLSLGDRLCLALADRMDAEVLTADAAWAGRPRVRMVR